MENGVSTQLPKDIAAIVVKLQDGDLLVCKVPDDVSPEQRHHLVKALRNAVDLTGRKNVACMLVSGEVDIDMLPGDRTLASLRAEIDELKATVAKYVTK